VKILLDYVLKMLQPTDFCILLTLSKSVIVPVALLALGCTNVIINKIIIKN